VFNSISYFPKGTQVAVEPAMSNAGGHLKAKPAVQKVKIGCNEARVKRLTRRTPRPSPGLPNNERDAETPARWIQACRPAGFEPCRGEKVSAQAAQADA
jgi:hypothetical protein